MIIDFINGGSGGIDSGAVQTQIEESLVPYWDSAETKDYVDSASSIFWASYGITSASDINEAVGAGKTVLCQYNSRIYQLTEYGYNCVFMSFSNPTTLYYLITTLSSGGNWLNGVNNVSSAGLFASVDYVSSAKTIYFYDKENAQVGTIDTTDFIKDGMIDTVYISGETMYIVFNTDSGKETIELNIGDIFDADNYYTKQETNSQISAATANFVTSGYVQDAIAQIDLSEIENRIEDVEFTTSEALNDLNTRLDNYSGGSADLSAYWTSAETIDYVDAAIAASGGSVDLSAYYTSAQTETAITSKGYITSGDVATQIESYDYLTSADTENFATSGQIYNVESTVSTALNELYTTLSGVTSQMEYCVTSTTVTTIWKGSQADYDLISPKDNNTLYIVV